MVRESPWNQSGRNQSGRCKVAFSEKEYDTSRHDMQTDEFITRQKPKKIF